MQPSDGFWEGVGASVGTSPGWMVIGALLVARGGTDATTALEARTNLGAASAEELQDVRDSLSKNKLVGSAVGFAGYAGIKGYDSERNQLLVGLTLDDGRTFSFDYQDDTKTLAVKFSDNQSGDQVLGKIQLS